MDAGPYVAMRPQVTADQQVFVHDGWCRIGAFPPFINRSLGGGVTVVPTYSF